MSVLMHFLAILSNYNGMTAYICRRFIQTTAFLVILMLLYFIFSAVCIFACLSFSIYLCFVTLILKNSLKFISLSQASQLCFRCSPLHIDIDGMLPTEGKFYSQMLQLLCRDSNGYFDSLLNI